MTLIHIQTCYCYYTPYTDQFVYLSNINCPCLLFLSTVLSDDDMGPHTRWRARSASRNAPPPKLALTPPPPGSPIQAQVRAGVQLRPVSIPDIVRDIAGGNPQQRIAAFDRHYIINLYGVPAPEASVQRNAEDHRLNLKRKLMAYPEVLAMFLPSLHKTLHHRMKRRNI